MLTVLRMPISRSMVAGFGDEHLDRFRFVIDWMAYPIATPANDAIY